MILYIEDRNIRVDDADNQISYNSDYIAEFHFDDEWNGKIKTARFVQNGEYVDVVLTNDRCEIPPLKTGFVRIGVFSDAMTSTYADVYYKTSIKDGSGNPVEPPEDVYAQLTALIESGMLKGADGLTPFIGSNNKWWIGDIDTGVLARGTDGYTPVKGVDYFTTEEIQQIQNEVSESIQANINHLEINKADKSELDKTNLSLNALWKMNRGQTYDVLEQESEAYSVDVPSGSKYASVDKVGGKSIVWNQLFPNALPQKKGGDGVTTVVTDSEYICTVTQPRSGGGIWFTHTEVKAPNNHKIYAVCQTYSEKATNLSYKSSTISAKNNVSANKWTKCDGIFDSDGRVIEIDVDTRTFEVGAIFKHRNFSFIDLTQMFGAGNEPSTVEELEAMFPDDNYPYSEPTIISSQTDRVDVASADGTITQQITTNFPALNSAGSVYDYIDLNEGKLHQRVGVVDLGTLDWRLDGAAYTFGKQTWLPDKDNFGAIINGYTFVNQSTDATNMDKIYKAVKWDVGYGAIYIKDTAYTDTTAFKEAMNGVMLYYELAEEVITDITIPTELTDWLTVEAGGSITFHNSDEGKRLLIPNKLSFVRKLDEVSV